MNANELTLNDLKQNFAEYRKQQIEKRKLKEQQYKQYPFVCSIEDLNRKRYSKPTTTEYSKVISTSIANNPTTTTLDELKTYITNGNAFSPALYYSEQGGLKQNQNFVCSQSLWLDFDLGYDLPTVLKRLKSYGFNVNAYYHTFSHSEKQHKFRVGILLDTVVFNPEMYTYLLKGFLKLFPEKFPVKNKKTGKKTYEYGLDKACMTAASMFIGTDKDFTILSYVPSRLDYVKTKIDGLYYDPKQGNRLVKTFNVCDNQNFTYLEDLQNTSVNNRLTAIYANNSVKMRIDVKHYSIYNSISRHSSLFNEMSHTDLTFKQLERVNFNYLIDNVLIVNDFANERELSNNELFGLLTNYRHFRGGLKYCEDVMLHNDNTGLTAYKEKDYVMLRQIASSDYAPMNLSEFSPYDEPHTSIYTAAKQQKKGNVKKLSDKPKISLSEAEKLFSDTLCHTITKQAEKNLIIAPTGIGKTQHLIKNIQHNKSGIVIALPTHKHIRNTVNNDGKTQSIGFADELEKMGLIEYVDFITTPKTPVFKTPEFNTVLSQLYDYEDFQGAKQYIKEVHKKTSTTHLPEDFKIASEYLNKIDGFYKCMGNDGFTGTVITTHRTMFFYDFPIKYKSYVFDEDFLQTGLIKTSTLALNEINKLKKIFAKHSFKRDLIMTIDEQHNGIKVNKKDVEAFFNDLLTKKEGVYSHGNDLTMQYVNDILYDETHDKNKGILRQFKHFLRSKAYYVQNSEKTVYTLYFGVKIDLREDINYIVLSATASKPLYEYLGFTINNECENIELQGELIQHTRTSFSKWSIGNISRKDKITMPELKDNSIILTFKQYTDFFIKQYPKCIVSDSVYFFNASGYNDFTGKDLYIFGTPVLNPATLIVLALECELNIDFTDINKLKEFKEQSVTYNDLEFKYSTYTDEVLQQLHLSTIEGELKQIVGRARLLRTDATVNLYSNFPLYEASTFLW